MQQFTPDKEPPNMNRRKGSYVFLEILQTILLAAAFYFAIDAVIDRVEVFNISMDPTVKQGEVIFVNKLAYRLGEVDRGDVVTFHYPEDPDYDYIKRAIGLPGDEVRIAEGEVYVNDIQLDEPYLPDHTTEGEGSWTVPEGMYFVMGDNRQGSSDSRSWGFVPEEDLIGKALAVYWPLNDMRVLTHYTIYP